ncbi:mannitol dehydrogenase family protein [Roseibium sp. DSM 29163]|uniref:Mannitol dehydrogenase family protein n=1 Tax=Roseibium salinum TaxID=1604349 RepID=A0ABT3R7F3_9HYPH|nr:mannitol dehydrogenase family protein [Roseibium sp. DSM 29163]MCX2725232.1 mannitol dehydrogenase family protein [Roseibium sp. DSM 29163]
MPADLARVARNKGPAPRAGIVHLGLGAFFRAHGAVYIEDATEKSGGDWGIIGVSLQSPTMRDQLAPQDFVYTAQELGPDGAKLRQVEIVRDVLVAREDPETVLAAMADPAIRIVTLTVTEKGYCHDPASGRLNRQHPDIQHDLASALPLSAPGYLARALQRRKAAGLPPFTVLTCDNLPDNGRLVKGIVLELARDIDPALADWIEAEGRFPATMVDRIVPATKPEDIEALADKTGRFDAAPVMCEPFSQWVVEDDFVPAYGKDARPDFAAVGVELVDNVTAYEHMKLRMLNGTHSSLAYLGYLAGHETIAETVADPVFAAYVKRLWRQEIIPSFTAPPGVDIAGYADALFGRYSNPGIRHRTWQIAMDGSQKLPQRILGTLRDNLAHGTPSPGLITAVAAWMIYVGGTDLNGRPIDVRDPLAARLKSLSDAAEGDADTVAALLGVTEIFDAGLAGALKPDLTTAYTRLKSDGVHRTLEALT